MTTAQNNIEKTCTSTFILANSNAILAYLTIIRVHSLKYHYMYLSKRVYKEVLGPNHSFSFNTEEQPYFYDRYHHHPEYEFTFIERGRGMRFVGDHIGHFEEGDLVLLGPNLSHMWKCDPHYYQNISQKACKSYVIHFPKQLMQNLLPSVPEMEPVRILLEQSKRGVKIEGSPETPLKECFRQLPEQNGGERFLSLLRILHLAATSNTNQVLSQSYISDERLEKSSERLNAIYNYMLSTLDKKISLSEIAAIANMSPTAFCRFFKQKTGKSFTHLLNEIRINHACRLLIEGQEKVAQIALASGFTNLSHFNSQFRAITGTTPKQFVESLK